MTATLTQDQVIALTRTADGDAQWFIDHPERNYRVRLAVPVEVAMDHAHCQIPKGMRAYAAIWQCEPCALCTTLFFGEADRDPNADETDAKSFVRIRRVVRRQACA